jgi:hypothetical protein
VPPLAGMGLAPAVKVRKEVEALLRLCMQGQKLLNRHQNGVVSSNSHKLGLGWKCWLGSARRPLAAGCSGRVQHGVAFMTALSPGAGSLLCPVECWISINSWLDRVCKTVGHTGSKFATPLLLLLTSALFHFHLILQVLVEEGWSYTLLPESGGHQLPSCSGGGGSRAGVRAGQKWGLPCLQRRARTFERRLKGVSRGGRMRACGGNKASRVGAGHCRMDPHMASLRQMLPRT